MRTLGSGSGSRRRARPVLIVLTLVAVTLIALDAAGVGIFDSLRNGAADVASPLSGVGDAVTEPLGDLWGGITGYGDLEAENRRLQERIDELTAERINAANAEEQLRRLNEQLQLGFVRDLPTQVARVASGPFSNFADFRVEIDKGSDAGLAEGMPVVTRAGLVGRLERVSGTRSVVQLASDPDFVIGVRLASSQDLGVGRGGGESNRFIVDRGIELTDPVRPGEAVLTSGLATAIMPPDIPVGTVEEAIADDTAGVQLLRVRFAAELSQLDVVQVVRWTPEP